MFSNQKLNNNQASLCHKSIVSLWFSNSKFETCSKFNSLLFVEYLVPNVHELPLIFADNACPFKIRAFQQHNSSFDVVEWRRSKRKIYRLGMVSVNRGKVLMSGTSCWLCLNANTLACWFRGWKTFKTSLWPHKKWNVMGESKDGTEKS